MSLGESVFSAGFIQKTVKGDLFVKGNYRIPPRKQRGKILEDSRRLSTEADPKDLPCGVGRPHLQAGWPVGSTSQPPLRKSVLHNLIDCINAVLSSRFDPRV
jgi:hypothetical protein